MADGGPRALQTPGTAAALLPGVGDGVSDGGGSGGGGGGGGGSGVGDGGSGGGSGGSVVQGTHSRRRGYTRKKVVYNADGSVASCVFCHIVAGTDPDRRPLVYARAL